MCAISLFFSLANPPYFSSFFKKGSFSWLGKGEGEEEDESRVFFLYPTAFHFPQQQAGNLIIICRSNSAFSSLLFSPFPPITYWCFKRWGFGSSSSAIKVWLGSIEGGRGDKLSGLEREKPRGKKGKLPSSLSPQFTFFPFWENTSLPSLSWLHTTLRSAKRFHRKCNFPFLPQIIRPKYVESRSKREISFSFSFFGGGGGKNTSDLWSL